MHLSLLNPSLSSSDHLICIVHIAMACFGLAVAIPDSLSPYTPAFSLEISHVDIPVSSDTGLILFFFFFAFKKKLTGPV